MLESHIKPVLCSNNFKRCGVILLKQDNCSEAPVYCMCGCMRLVATRYDWDEEKPAYVEVVFKCKEDFKNQTDDCNNLLKEDSF